MVEVLEKEKEKEVTTGPWGLGGPDHLCMGPEPNPRFTGDWQLFRTLPGRGLDHLDRVRLSHADEAESSGARHVFRT